MLDILNVDPKILHPLENFCDLGHSFAGKMNFCSFFPVRHHRVPGVPAGYMNGRNVRSVDQAIMATRPMLVASHVRKSRSNVPDQPLLHGFSK
jgi:hypothetical protein